MSLIEESSYDYISAIDFCLLKLILAVFSIEFFSVYQKKCISLHICCIYIFNRLHGGAIKPGSIYVT